MGTVGGKVRRPIVRNKLTNWLLYALRLKWEAMPYQWGKCEEISENDMRCVRGGKFRRGEPITNMAIPLGKLTAGKLGRFSLSRMPYAEIHEGASLIEGDLFTPWKINRFRSVTRKRAHTWVQIGN